jgi:hypothetical protein
LPLVFSIFLVICGGFIRLAILLQTVAAFGFAFVVAFDFAFAFFEVPALCLLFLFPPQILCLCEKYEAK